MRRKAAEEIKAREAPVECRPRSEELSISAEGEQDAMERAAASEDKEDLKMDALNEKFLNEKKEEEQGEGSEEESKGREEGSGSEEAREEGARRKLLPSDEFFEKTEAGGRPKD